MARREATVTKIALFDAEIKWPDKVTEPATSLKDYLEAFAAAVTANSEAGKYLFDKEKNTQQPRQLIQVTQQEVLESGDLAILLWHGDANAPPPSSVDLTSAVVTPVQTPAGSAPAFSLHLVFLLSKVTYLRNVPVVMEFGSHTSATIVGRAFTRMMSKLTAVSREKGKKAHGIIQFDGCKAETLGQGMGRGVTIEGAVLVDKKPRIAESAPTSATPLERTFEFGINTTVDDRTGLKNVVNWLGIFGAKNGYGSEVRLKIQDGQTKKTVSVADIEQLFLTAYSPTKTIDELDPALEQCALTLHEGLVGQMQEFGNGHIPTSRAS